MDLKSARKKLKDKSFARSVSRDDIVNGASEMGIDLDQHIAFCIQAMKPQAAAIRGRRYGVKWRKAVRIEHTSSSRSRTTVLKTARDTSTQ